MGAEHPKTQIASGLEREGGPGGVRARVVETHPRWAEMREIMAIGIRSICGAELRPLLLDVSTIAAAAKT